MIEIGTIPTLKHLLQYETLNANKNKSYYQQNDVKIMISFHKQAMIKQQIYGNILARRSGVDYIPGIQFQTSLISID